MGRFGCLTSILLMIFAVGALIFFVAAPESVTKDPDIIKFKNSLFCEPNEEYVEVLGPYSYSTSTSSGGRQFNAYCEDAEGRQREVTARSFAIMAGAFAVPFVVGLLLFIFSIAAMGRRVQKRIVQQVMPGGVNVTVRGQNYPADISVSALNGSDPASPQDAAKIVQDMLNGFTSDAVNVFTRAAGAAQGDLKSRLRQLEEALSANLISRAEYDRIRQQILDSMDDLKP